MTINFTMQQGWLYENIGNHTFVRYKPYFEGSNHTFIIILRICKENNISHFISKPYSDHTFDLQTILIWSNHTYNHPWASLWSSCSCDKPDRDNDASHALAIGARIARTIFSTAMNESSTCFVCRLTAWRILKSSCGIVALTFAGNVNPQHFCNNSW